MKKLRIVPLLLMCVILLSSLCPAALALEEPPLASNAVLLMETASQNILLTQNENVRVYPASTTKIMTVLLAIEAVEDGRIKLSDTVTATENMNYDLIPDGSSAGILPGETMTLEELLYCAMLASGNDACNVIAEYVGGSIPAFITMMNDRATELGCIGTQFVNTHGLPNESHYTTVWDFGHIALEAISHSEFMDISDTATYEIPATNMSEKRVLSNSNGLINEKSVVYPGYKYEFAHGVKTGYTTSAGYCLVSTAEKDGIELLCVIMGGVVTDNNGALSYSNFADSRTLYDWGFENFSFHNLLTTDKIITSVPVTMSADADKVTLKPQNILTAFLPNDIDLASLEMDIVTELGEDGKSLQAPIGAGEVLGSVTVSYNGVSYGTVKLIASSSIDLSKMSFLKTEAAKLIDKMWVKVLIIVLIMLFVLYVAAVMIYRRRRYKYIKYMRAKQAQDRRKRREADERRRQDPVPELQPERELVMAGRREDAAEQAPSYTTFDEPQPSYTPYEEPRQQDYPIYEEPQPSYPTYEEEPRERAIDRDYFDEFFKK